MATERKVVLPPINYERSPDSGRAKRRSVMTGDRGRRRPGRARRRRSIWRSAASTCVLLDDTDRIGEGSRGICCAKRTLEILDRLGVGEQHGRAGRHLEARQGLSQATNWSIRSTCCRKPATRCRPSSISSNIIVEKVLVERALELAELIDLRWRNQGRPASSGATTARR